LIELIQRRFLFAPIEVMAPIPAKTLQLRDVSTVIPWFTDLIGPARLIEP
jgi:hypothetical protein